MPTYEYKCEDCGYIFEEFQSMKHRPLEKCPECKGEVQRLISSGGGIIFKGLGFYTIDYADSIPPACGRDKPCCGRDTPCDSKPCES
jgi:putative FmdB family regulatory protein